MSATSPLPRHGSESSITRRASPDGLSQLSPPGSSTPAPAALAQSTDTHDHSQRARIPTTRPPSSAAEVRQAYTEQQVDACIAQVKASLAKPFWYHRSEHEDEITYRPVTIDVPNVGRVTFRVTLWERDLADIPPGWREWPKALFYAVTICCTFNFRHVSARDVPAARIRWTHVEGHRHADQINQMIDQIAAKQGATVEEYTQPVS